MADTAPPPPSSWKAALKPAATALLKYVLPALAAAVLTYLGVPPEVVETVKEVPYVVGVKADETADFGWRPPTPEQVAEAIDPEKTTQFALTPAGKAVMGDEDAFLWKAFGGGVSPWVNQRDVGCCVGCGFAHGCDVLGAVEAKRNPLVEWRKISVEVIYAGSRNEVLNGQIRGDGSYGGAAAKFLTGYGAAEAKKYAGVDLAEFSPARARSMGAAGQRLAADVVAAAKSNPVKGAALVRSFDDVSRALRQGYPVAVCSNVGFTGHDRDADGFLRASGQWAHCMCFIGVRGGHRPGAFCLNSWGPTVHAGPRWPADAPPNGFWVEPATIDRMVRQNDSYALSDMVGFPSRALPFWFIRAPRPEANFAFRAAPFLRARDLTARPSNGPVLVTPSSVAW